MVQQEDLISVRLSVVEWNQIVGMLGKNPYESVVQLIMKISMQAQKQIDAANEASTLVPNGVDHDQADIPAEPQLKPVRAPREKNRENW